MSDQPRYVSATGIVHELAPKMQVTTRCGRSTHILQPTHKPVSCRVCLQFRKKAKP